METEVAVRLAISAWMLALPSAELTFVQMTLYPASSSWFVIGGIVNWRRSRWASTVAACVNGREIDVAVLERTAKRPKVKDNWTIFELAVANLI